MVISPKQRDALYDAVLLKISGIDALPLAIEADDFVKASALGREFSDYLRVLNEDLGWGPAPENHFELVAPPDVWGRVLLQLRDQSVDAAAEVAGERSELEKQEERMLRVRDSCEQLLGQS